MDSLEGCTDSLGGCTDSLGGCTRIHSQKIIVHPKVHVSRNSSNL